MNKKQWKQEAKYWRKAFNAENSYHQEARELLQAVKAQAGEQVRMLRETIGKLREEARGSAATITRQRDRIDELEARKDAEVVLRQRERINELEADEKKVAEDWRRAYNTDVNAKEDRIRELQGFEANFAKAAYTLSPLIGQFPGDFPQDSNLFEQTVLLVRRLESDRQTLLEGITEINKKVEDAQGEFARWKSNRTDVLERTQAERDSYLAQVQHALRAILQLPTEPDDAKLLTPARQITAIARRIRDGRWTKWDGANWVFMDPDVDKPGLQPQIDRLGAYLMNYYPKALKGGGAVDTAIEIMDEYRQEISNEWGNGDEVESSKAVFVHPVDEKDWEDDMPVGSDRPNVLKKD